MQKHLSEFEGRGVQVVAVSVDPPETTRRHCEKQGYTFTFLSDEQTEVIRRYDLLHEDGGPMGDIARPAEFLLDPSGTIRWVNLSEDYRVRARPEEMLKAIDAVRQPPSPARR